MKKGRHDKGWRFRGHERKYVNEVLENGLGSGTTGSFNLRLEELFAKKMGVKYAITSNSGTSTLHQALIAGGIGPGDEVIIPALTVAMCGFVVVHVGATPVFADIDPKTFLMDPKDVERKITKRTKAIMPVHLYGLMCDMDTIMRIAKKHKLFVIEDCAECVLGKDNKGRIGGTIGDVGSFSLQTTKHLATGDGGILISNDEKVARNMRKFGGQGFKHVQADRRMIKKNRDLFQDPAYLRHDSIGTNYRMPELLAAVGLAQVEKIDMLVKKHQQMGLMFEEVIKKTKCSWLIPQVTPKGYEHSYYTFVARYEGEEAFGVSWYDFRRKFMELGGDGIYAAWALVYKEPGFQLLHTKGKFNDEVGAVQAPHLFGYLAHVSCPVAEEVQPRLMQFTTNQANTAEMRVQARALEKTIAFFENERA